MAIPTPVNSQITDAVTQANTKALGDAPAMALGNLYIATAQALANAAHNATTSQQQSAITAQAATTMGVSILLSLGAANNDATALAKSASPQDLTAMLPPPAGVQTIEDALEFVNKLVIGSAEPWANAIKEVMLAVATALLELQKVSRTTNMDIFKQAALCAAVARMINAPEQLEQYQKIIELIRQL